MNIKVIFFAVMGLAAMQSGLAAAPVAAQSSPFVGGYGQIGVGYESTRLKDTGGGYNGASYTQPTQNLNSFKSGITAGYNFAVSESFLLGVGADMSPLKGRQSDTLASTTDGVKSFQTWQQQRSYNIFLSPGYVVSKDALAYAKVGYARAAIRYVGDPSLTTNYKGYSLGVGYKQFIINQSVYGFGEVNYAKYGSQGDGPGLTGTNTPASTNFLVGVGIKF